MTPPSQRLALIPLDDRPCCRLFPVRLAAMAGHRLEIPPRRLLGKYLDPGNPDRLMDWLDSHLRSRPGSPTGLLLSLDMLVWGGLVASRRFGLSPTEAVNNLKRLALLTRHQPTWAFMSLMRTAPTQTSLEEVEQATRLTELALWMSRQARDLPGASEKVQALLQGIPALWVDRYLKARRRNLFLNLMALRYATESDWRHLLLGIDDSRTEGLNVLEAARLEAAIGELKAPATVAPGTDEMAQLMLVRALAPGTELSVHFSKRSDLDRVTRYEDRSLLGVVQAQVQAAGIKLSDGATRQLWVYGPRGEQQEASRQAPLRRRSRRAARFVQALCSALDEGACVAVADVSRANGADLGLVEELLQAEVLPRLAGYAGWNTAGNTLGTALACAALASARPTPATEGARLSFLLERMADDFLFQAALRQEISAPLGGCFMRLEGARLKETREKVQEIMAERVLQFFEENFASTLFEGRRPHLTRVAIDLPWPRTFEVEVQARIDY
ncbi:MAG: DUF4127 family protein [Candidatus Xenobium sp.]|jgi:hypothetical protein|nr:DUF4127 family protein [Burkholderiales bacterium]